MLLFQNLLLSEDVCRAPTANPDLSMCSHAAAGLWPRTIKPMQHVCPFEVHGARQPTSHIPQKSIVEPSRLRRQVKASLERDQYPESGARPRESPKVGIDTAFRIAGEQGYLVPQPQMLAGEIEEMKFANTGKRDVHL
jgi:hypothetical protein